MYGVRLEIDEQMCERYGLTFDPTFFLVLFYFILFLIETDFFKFKFLKSLYTLLLLYCFILSNLIYLFYFFKFVTGFVTFC